MDWSEQVLWRERIHRRYPEIWNLKIVRKRLPFILKYLREGESILEIGAFDRVLGERIRSQSPLVRYKSMDIDSTYPHDYTSLEEIRETFDVILLFEVIEHLGLEQGRAMVARIFQILNGGGRVILSTPNVYTPGQYWKDVSHLTPYHYDELGGLLLSQGFEVVEICRYFHDAFLPFFLKAYLSRPLFRLLGVDFSKSIFLVAKKA